MTRFAAESPADRRKLFVDAVVAHRERASAYLTVEADPESEDDPAPWVQFGDRTFNLDCTDEELSRLKSLLDAYPEFRIDRLETPEEAEGTNVRITARSDANRLAAFVDDVFRRVYDRPETYRAWVAAV
jgi:hypothetical protein